MKLTYSGHATWLAQHGRTRLLMDPVLMPTFIDGYFEMSPSRRVRLERLPRIDAIAISHSHRDHLDVASLAALDRTTPILCPNDPLIRHVATRLGYREVHTVEAWSLEDVGDLQLLFTPSDVSFPELGVLLLGGDTSFWNQVDTRVTSKAFAEVNRLVGRVDLCAFSYQPMRESELLSGEAFGFPFAMYADRLQVLKAVRPKAIVPASGGYRLTGDAAWFNAFKFPLSRRRFGADVERLLPGTPTLCADPGDVLEIHRSGTRLKRQAADRGFVQTLRDDAETSTAFDPNLARPPVLDRNPLCVPIRQLRLSAALFFEGRVPDVATTAFDRGHPVWALQPRVEIRLRTPEGKLDRWGLVFGQRSVEVSRRGINDPDVVVEMPASALHDLVTGRRDIESVLLGGELRVASLLYRLDPTGLRTDSHLCPPGIYSTPFSPIDILPRFLYPTAEAHLQRLDIEIGRVLGEGDPLPSRPFWERASVLATGGVRRG